MRDWRAARWLVGLARACHPEATFAVTLVLTLLAVLVRRGALGTVEVAGAVLASQLCVGWSNDWLDARRDELVGRRDKPIPSGQVSRRTVGVAALVAGPVTVGLALLSGVPAAIALTIGLLCGLAYNWPLKFTLASPLPYLVAFGAVAAFVVLGRRGAPVPPWWLVVAAALLGSGAHFANVLPDLVDDARTGVRGLPQRLGATGSWVAASALLAGATATLAFGPPGPPSWAGVAIFVAAVVVLPIGRYASNRPGSRAAFRSVLLVAVADVVLLLISGSTL
jgi:heme o synthase